MKTAYLVYLTAKARAATTVDGLVAASGMCRADADRVMKSRLPVAVGHCGSRDEATALIRRLRAGGLDGLAITPAAARRFSPTPLRSALIGRAVTVRAAERTIVLHDLKMIVLGKIHNSVSTVSRGSLDALATGVAFGMPFGAPVRTREFEDRVVAQSDRSFVCLFADEPFVIYEDNFDYRSVLREMCPTREQSFLSVVKTFRTCFPKAGFDDAIYRSQRLLPVSESRERWFRGGLFNSDTTSTTSDSSERALRLAQLIYLQNS